MAGILAAINGAFGRVTCFDIAGQVGSHAHPHVHLLFKIHGANRLMFIEGQPVRLDGDTCVLMNPWQEHCDARPEDGATTRMLALYLDPAWLAANLGVRWQPGFQRSTARLSACARHRVAAIQQDLSGDANIEDMLLDLIADISEPLSSPTEPRRSADYRIRNAVQRLKETPQLHNDFRSIARDVGLSRSRFFQQFRNSVGVAPAMFVDSLLIEEAIRMLAGSGQPLAQISTELGFAAPSSFTRFFKERVGFTPSHVRRCVEESAV
jgi:AraC-like DNA-binding protein